MAFDTLMPDGKTLQIGTVHNLGQTFAKTFDITFENDKGSHDYVYQTCYGMSDRVIASIIGIHGDDNGLILPPIVSPKHITIIPILFKDTKEKVLAKCEEIKTELESYGIRVNIDTRDIRPGKKFFDWEVKGTPLRAEIGPKDLENNKTFITRRDTMEKLEFSLDLDLVSKIKTLISDINLNMSEKSARFLEESIAYTENLEEIPTLINSGKVVAFNWDGENSTGEAIEEETNFDILGIHKELDNDKGFKCIYSGKDAKYLALIAKTY